MADIIYGIDLGTTNSAIAVYENEKARIIRNLEGQEATPSVVYFTGTDSEGNDETVVGLEAKNAAAEDPDHVVQFIKRFMGNLSLGYTVTAPSGKRYTPEMISALILRKLCRDAEAYEGEGAVRDVVITVPAYFDDAARTATKQAGEIAGLNVLRVLNEPTAAAIAFGLDSSQEGRVLVYDLGGGTFDVTVMEIRGGQFEVLATGGNHQLGGMNFDQKILELLLRQLEESGCQVDLDDEAFMRDLRERAEKTKVQLSSVKTVRPSVSVGGKAYRLSITREDFEAASQILMEQTRIIAEDTLAQAGLTWADIDHLLVTGGSTRMPMVKNLLQTLSGKEITYKVNPDLAVAEGAAIFAAALAGEEESISILDVTSQSLGIITVDTEHDRRRVNTIIIPHNTKIPARNAQTVYTLEDQQASLLIEVTEGDDPDVEYVKIIAEQTLSIPPHPANSPVEVIFAYDADQTIDIELIDQTEGKSLGHIKIDRSANLTQDQVSDAEAIVRNIAVE